jgi:hypothetical protein
MNLLKNTSIKTIISLLLVASLFTTTFIPLASAHTLNKTDNQEQNIEEIAQQLEILFDQASKKENGKFVVSNKQLLVQKYGEKNANNLVFLVDLLNQSKNINKEQTNLNVQQAQINSNALHRAVVMSSSAKNTSYGQCIINKYIQSYGSIVAAFVTGTIWRYVNNKEYYLAAKILAKLMIKAGIKTSVVAMAGELAWYAIACA